MDAGHLLRWRNLCYILIMREWMRARMRRRTKRGPNDSESTGKIGQEFQPTSRALAAYVSGRPTRTAPNAAADSHSVKTERMQQRKWPKPDSARAFVSSGLLPMPCHHRAQLPRVQRRMRRPAEGKLVVETQPESPSVPPPELPAASQKDLKGYVVLAIGLPGSGKPHGSSAAA